MLVLVGEEGRLGTGDDDDEEDDEDEEEVVMYRSLGFLVVLFFVFWRLEGLVLTEFSFVAAMEVDWRRGWPFVCV